MRIGLFLGFFVQSILAALGPQSLYQNLSPLTLFLSSPGGTSYEIKPYNEFIQLGSQNISYGTFQTYVSYGGTYIYQSYNGGSTALGCSPRSIELTIACGSQISLGAVTESPSCRYYGTLYTPSACGINFAVGQETASVSATPSPAVSASPLFMMTAWPTTSPVNVSATSTPLFYWTPYPSYDPNNGTSPFAFLASTSGTTATILGAVAVGGLGLAGIAYVINHFRKGGSIKDLFSKAMANRKKISNMVKDIPIVPDSIKKGLDAPESLLPTEAQKYVTMSKNPHSVIDSLGLSPEVSSAAKSLVPKSSDEMIELVQNPSKARTKLQKESEKVIPSHLKELLSSVSSKKINKSNTEIAETAEDLDDTPKNILVDQGVVLKPKDITISTEINDIDKTTNNQTIESSISKIDIKENIKENIKDNVKDNKEK